MEVDAGCGSPGPIYIFKTSQEESKQQIAIPSTTSARPLLLVHPRARSSPAASSALSTGKKPSAEKDIPRQTNGTMSVSQKVKKIGKPRAPLTMDRYIALISCNGNFPHFYSDNNKGHWSMKQRVSKSQRAANLPPAYGTWHGEMELGSVGSRAQWKIEAEHYLLGLGGQFNVQVKA
ncbi:hypothetical protein OIDMADRAFT_48527 [Oidiodendron maius Zn]|uniref:Uncharacterized protein n=1 Tax=Oidiodendron maius (strain Zn) TaxID=913774 RepID=A0A0C3DBH4_OIDMZ|nr:hypothetical protein OIDMADRAFT_48527 [Oidiodendron maius Zn]